MTPQKKKQNSGLIIPFLLNEHGYLCEVKRVVPPPPNLAVIC